MNTITLSNDHQITNPLHLATTKPPQTKPLSGHCSEIKAMPLSSLLYLAIFGLTA